MSNRIKELISCVKQIDAIPSKDKKDIISILENIDPNTYEKNDNVISRDIITIISLFPKIMQNHESQALKQLCLRLKPTQIDLSSIVREKFFASEKTKHEPRKPSPKR